MCNAIEDMLEDAKNEGRKEEHEEMCKAIEDMMEDARNEGKKEERIDTLLSLVNKGIISISQAAEEAGMTVPEFEARWSAKK